MLAYLGVLWLLLSVGLALYQLYYQPNVKIEWDTATEMETAGFYLYRSRSPDGEFAVINDSLIPSKGDSFSGATYSYVDVDVKAGDTYYYILEEVELDSGTNRYQDEMFSYTVPQTWWLIVSSAISSMVGLALLVTGLKESRDT